MPSAGARRARDTVPVDPIWVAADQRPLSTHGVIPGCAAAGLARECVSLAFFSGDPRDVRSYHAYGAEVRSVADATVVRVKHGLPDNIPRTAAGFETAVPVTMETVAGNSVVLDLGDGQYAYYAHLKPGSVRVRTGDRVRRGEVVGAIGNSGDAREPHLHFQVTNGADILASEGLPYVIDRFRMKRPEGTWQERRKEFPPGDATIDFDVR